jgi:hypothetical protein
LSSSSADQQALAEWRKWRAFLVALLNRVHGAFDLALAVVADAPVADTEAASDTYASASGGGAGSSGIGGGGSCTVTNSEGASGFGHTGDATPLALKLDAKGHLQAKTVKAMAGVAGVAGAPADGSDLRDSKTVFGDFVDTADGGGGGATGGGGDGGDTEAAEVAAAAQRIVVGSWLTVRECAAVLAGLVQRVPLPVARAGGTDGDVDMGQDVIGACSAKAGGGAGGAGASAGAGVGAGVPPLSSLLTAAEVHGIGLRLLRAMLTLKHMGAIAATQEALQTVCECLLHHGDAHPQVHTGMRMGTYRAGMFSSGTHRPAGLPGAPGAHLFTSIHLTKQKQRRTDLNAGSLFSLSLSLSLLSLSLSRATKHTKALPPPVGLAVLPPPPPHGARGHAPAVRPPTQRRIRILVRLDLES